MKTIYVMLYILKILQENIFNFKNNFNLYKIINESH